MHRVLSKLPPSFKFHVLFLKLGTHRVGEQPQSIKPSISPMLVKILSQNVLKRQQMSEKCSICIMYVMQGIKS